MMNGGSGKTTTVSAPGKVLLAGGYLVLESPNVGLVAASDKRFYTTVRSTRSTTIDNNNDVNENDKSMTIVVKSPQFHSSWTFEFDYCNETEVTYLRPSIENASENGFVEKTLRIVMTYLATQNAKLGGGGGDNNSNLLEVTIKADNDFYSVIPHIDGKPRTPATVENLPKFLNCPKDPTTGKAIINKTGLGSSAALVTSLVGALYYHFTPASKTRICEDSANRDGNDEDDDDEECTTPQEIIHNLAQLCHCHAQGKVGSGFDVSAAIHGTHVYRRFPKCILPDILNLLGSSSSHDEADPSMVAASTSQLLAHVVHSTWAHNIHTPLAIPTGLQILLADVCGGSESPSMARKVVAWKQQQITQGGASPLAIPHWSDLKRLNEEIVQVMQSLSSNGSIDVEKLSKLPASEWKATLTDDDDSATAKATGLLIELHEKLVSSRTHLRQMGEAAGVPIEPPEQTELCDATMKVPGVVAAMVPGAGGYDAIACLFLDTPNVKLEIGALWESWKGSKNDGTIICPLSVQASAEGLRIES